MARYIASTCQEKYQAVLYVAKRFLPVNPLGPLTPRSPVSPLSPELTINYNNDIILVL